MVTVGGPVHECEASFHPVEWLKHSMDKRVILKIVLPKLDPEFHVYKSFKITPRWVSGHNYLVCLNWNDGNILETHLAVIFKNT